MTDLSEDGVGLVRTNIVACSPGVKNPFFSKPPPIDSVRLLVLQENSEEHANIWWLLNRDPYIGGYKYIILATSFITLFTFSVTLSASMYSSHLEKEFNVGHSESSIFTSLEFGIFCGFSLFVARIMDIIGVLPLLYLSLFLVCAGQFICSFIQDYWGITIVYAIICGAGAAGCQMLGMLICNDWYEPSGRTGFSTGFSLAAVGVGGVGWTYYMQFFLDRYSWRVCMRYCALLSALLSLVVVLMARIRTVTESQKKGIVLDMINQDITWLVQQSNQAPVSPAITPLVTAVTPDVTPATSSTNTPADFVDFSHVNASSDESQPLSPSKVLSASDLHITSTELFGPTPPFLYLSPLLKPRFVIFMITVFLSTFIFYAPYVHIISHAIDEGVPPGDASFLLVIVGIMNLGCRPIFGALADKFGGLSVFLLSNVLQTFGTVLWLYTDKLSMFQGVAVIMGLGGAAFIIGCSYTPGYLVEPFEISSAMGFIFGIAFIPGATAMGPIMGSDHDANGNYNAVLTAFSVIQGFAVLLNIITILPIWKSVDEIRAEKANAKVNTVEMAPLSVINGESCKDQLSKEDDRSAEPSMVKLQRYDSSTNLRSDSTASKEVYEAGKRNIYVYPAGREEFFRVYADHHIRAKLHDMA